MTTPNLNAVEPICSWRLKDPYLELKVSRDRKNIWYSVCNHFDNSYWPNSASSLTYLVSIFEHCVWKGVKKNIDSRLFSDGQEAVCVSVDLQTEKIGIKEWEDGSWKDFLTKKNPLILAINDDGSLEFKEEPRDSDRSKAYDLEAEVGITRWCKTEKGERAIEEEGPVTETTMSVAPGNESTKGEDIRHIKRIEGKKEKDIFRLFNWETKKTSEVPYKIPQSSEGGVLPKEIGDCTFEIIDTNNGKELVLHKTPPLDCFMLGSDLFIAKPSHVEKWVYKQFYGGSGDKKTSFKYTNFVRASKKPFSFNKGIKEERAKDGVSRSSEVDAWCVEMKRSASVVWQIPIGLQSFFTELFYTQTPPDLNNMKGFVQGIPMGEADRKRALDDFEAELKACSIINFYITCDRSLSRLEIDGRVWVRSFSRAGQGIGYVGSGAGKGIMYVVEGVGGGIASLGNTAVKGVKGIANTAQKIEMKDVNKGMKTVYKVVKTAGKLQTAWNALNGASAPQDSSAQNT